MKPEQVTPEQIKSIEAAGYKYHFDKENFDADHPLGYQNEICAWAAHRIRTINVFDVLDIGSYLDFVSGMSCNMEVSMLDSRRVPLRLSGINHIVGDATDIPENDEMFDLVTSLSVMEHVGTGAFGDKLDVDADDKMISEVHRVLRPNSDFVMTTQVAKEAQFIVNCHRLYTEKMLHDKLTNAGFSIVDAVKMEKHCRGDISKHWDIFCIHARKK